MTKDEQNDLIGKIVEPDKCRHKPKKNTKHWDGRFRYRCSECGERFRDNTDYFTFTGIPLIKEWLEREELWLSWDTGHDKESISFIKFLEGQGYGINGIVNIMTLPKIFCEKFIQYAKENNLG